MKSPASGAGVALLVLLAGLLIAVVVRPTASHGGSKAGQLVPDRPRSAVEVYPGDDIQARVAEAPAGTTFLLKAGVHRLQTIRPRERDTFAGEPGTVLSGAQVLPTFIRVGGRWVAPGQTQQGPPHGNCQRGYPRCRFPEELFIDDQVLRHVGSLDEVVPGTWFFDYEADQIVLGTDPAGHRVETSVALRAFEATGNNVTITGLTIEKYANPAQSGAIHADGKSGWTIADNEVRWNHGVGIRIGSGARVTGNRVHHNGQLGIGGVGSDVLIENNEIASNNTAHFDADWEAGGTKFVNTSNLVVRGNFVHHNDGPGLWTDIDNVNTVYEGNTSEDNQRMGIFHEISYAAKIRSNIVRRNGFGFPDWIWGAGILIAASPDVEVYDNTVEGNADGIGAAQQARGSGAFGPHQLSNLWVHDNWIVMNHGQTGIVEDVGDQSYYTSRNNRFDRNRYHLGPGELFFAWMNGERSDSEWRRFGQDVNGTFSR